MFGNPFSQYNEFVLGKTSEYWDLMIKDGSIDAVETIIDESREKCERLVDVNTIEHTDACEIGAEWICLQALRELEFDRFLQNEGWSETMIDTALAHLIRFIRNME